MKSLEWVEVAYSQVFQSNNEGAVDVIFDQLDQLLLDGDFLKCDEVLREIDVNLLNAHTIIAILSVTLRASKKLENRVDFVSRARQRLEEITPNRVDVLLLGLK